MFYVMGENADSACMCGKQLRMPLIIGQDQIMQLKNSKATGQL